MRDATVTGHIGTVSRQWAAGDFNFGWWRTREFGPHVEEHEHQKAHVLFVCAGDYRSCVPGLGQVPYKIIYNPAGTVHVDRFESPGLFFSMIFERSPAEVFESAAPDQARLARSCSARALLELMTKPVPQAEVGDLEFLAAELLLEFSANPPVERTPAWMGRVLDSLRSGANAPKVGELARIAGVHPYHLAATFRRLHRCTPTAYVRGLRLDRALTTLLSTRAPLAEIAHEHGYADQSHFSRGVAQRFGIGPAALRRRLS